MESVEAAGALGTGESSILFWEKVVQKGRMELGQGLPNLHDHQTLGMSSVIPAHPLHMGRNRAKGSSPLSVLSWAVPKTTWARGPLV